MGTVQGDMAIPAGSALGYYGSQIHVGEGEVGAGFHVEAYTKPESAVRVAPDKKRVLQGSPVQALIAARYFIGEPVARGSVKYVVQKFRYWYPLYADPDEESDDSGDDNYYGQGEQILEESGQLDADGKLSVSIPTEMSPQKWDTRYRIEARVTDSANREIAGAASVLATTGSFMPNIQPDQYVYEPGGTATLAITPRHADGRGGGPLTFSQAGCQGVATGTDRGGSGSRRIRSELLFERGLPAGRQAAPGIEEPFRSGRGAAVEGGGNPLEGRIQTGRSRC